MRWQTYLLPNQVVEKRDRRMIAGGVTALVLLCWATIPITFLPKPGEVLRALRTLWTDGDLGEQLLISLWLNAQAITLAAVVSLLLAYMWTIAVFRPIVVFIGQLRFLSFAGLGFAFTLMTSNGNELKLLVLVFMVVVFMVVGMVDVIASIPKEQFDLARTLRMGDWEVLWEVVILGQIDQAFVVWRQNAAMGYMMLATAEGMYMAGGGIGTMLNTSNKYLNLAAIMALQLVVLAVGKVLQDQVIGWLRHTCCRYADLGKR
jgi:NitT/TauT family transport system permease protein